MMSMLGQQSGMLGKIPGMGKLAGAGMGGFPGMGGMGGLDPAAMLGGGLGRTGAPRSRAADARRKNKRKQAKKSRRKGRKH
jgi:hypothetical protein